MLDIRNEDLKSKNQLIEANEKKHVEEIVAKDMQVNKLEEENARLMKKLEQI